MTKIYENKVKAMGDCVAEFQDANLFILFGDNAPAELQDYCYSVDVLPINGKIEAGQTLKIDDNSYRITAVGWEAPVTLAGLGHCTFNFSGQTEVEQPGTIYVESKPMPTLQIGSVIQIVAE
jgi:PTS system glucitol/sorbitol-specific IIA component